MVLYLRHVTQLSTNQVVTQTSKNIARLTILMKRGDKQQKLQIEKLTTDFKDALQRYSDVQKVSEGLLSKILNLLYFYSLLTYRVIFVLQSIAEKLKRHILVTGSIEYQPEEGDDDTNNLIQVQEDAERRAAQRLVVRYY